MADPIFVDLSHWNPDPDWKALMAGGVTGVILKATEGTGTVDPTFRKRYDAAIQAGLAVATYHFLKPGNIQTQMNFWLNTVQPRPGERMCIDHEDKATLAELEQAVTILQSDSRNLQVTVYSGHLIKDQLGSKQSAILATTSLWIAQYTSAASPTWPGQVWPNWTLWQYTDKASVGGIGQPVDGNRFNGSDQNALNWLNPAGEIIPQPAPAPDPGPEPGDVVDVLISVQTSPGLTVAVLVNGEQVL